MRKNKKNQGFTLIELLIVIAIIGILAAVLIPNLLNARARAFDTAAQTCLREISTLEEVIRSDSPFLYSTADETEDIDPEEINACTNVEVAELTGDQSALWPDTATIAGDGTDYGWAAAHKDGSSWYGVRDGQGVVRGGSVDDTDAPVDGKN